MTEITKSEMKKILESSKWYWNFLMITHQDGKTPAESLGVTSDIIPKWMNDWLSKQQKTELSSVERTQIERDLTGFHGNFITVTANEIASGKLSKRSAAIKELTSILSPERMEELDNIFIKARNLNNPISSTQKNWPFPKVIVPFIAIYAYGKIPLIRNRLEKGITYTVFFMGQERHIMVDQIESWQYSIYIEPEEGGTKLGTVELGPDMGALIISSINLERYNALKDLLIKLFPKIQLVRELQNVNLGELKF